ncbi:MAG: nucleotide exchange factor GrpE [Candidatus Sumerlaeia bacterium]|nr:nucleotide exchange factor GrpE [Candidatus Sumerlaeia bacterium]
MTALRQWLWKGSFEPAAGRLEVWEGLAEAGAGGDLLERTAGHLAELGRLADLAREAEARQDSGSEEEVRNLVRAMLPALDALDRLLDYGSKMTDRSPELENWVKSVEAIQIRMAKSLERVGLVTLGTVGSQVNLDLHDVVEMRPSREYPEGTVIEERLKGYYFRGRLLRDAKVVVALPA